MENMSKMLRIYLIFCCIVGNFNCDFKICVFFFRGMVWMYKILNLICVDCNIWNVLNLIL